MAILPQDQLRTDKLIPLRRKLGTSNIKRRSQNAFQGIGPTPLLICPASSAHPRGFHFCTRSQNDSTHLSEILAGAEFRQEYPAGVIHPHNNVHRIVVAVIGNRIVTSPVNVQGITCRRLTARPGLQPITLKNHQCLVPGAAGTRPNQVRGCRLKVSK